jgi:hypothetical protein
MVWKFRKIFYTSRIFVKAVQPAEAVRSVMGALIVENAIRSDFIEYIGVQNAPFCTLENLGCIVSFVESLAICKTA